MINIKKLAGEIYDLDTAVYKALGSNLGRVFTGKKRNCVRRMLSTMTERQNTHVLRSSMAMIANMARTIPDPEVKNEIMQKYQAIMNQIEELPDSFDKIDILDPELARLHNVDLTNRFAKDDHLIICISRTYGSAGSSIGFKLAEELNINFYDVEIFDMVLKRMQANKEKFVDHLERPHVFDKVARRYVRKSPTIRNKLKPIVDFFKDLNRYHGLPRRDAIFFNQSQLMCELAEKEAFVVMGRCADVILTNNQIPHISIFITAPMEQRIQHLCQIDPNLDRKKALRLILKNDRMHREYYRFYTGRRWGLSSNYDLCINSAAYGINGSVDLIKQIIGSNPGLNVGQ